MATIAVQDIMQRSGVVFGTSGARGLVTQLSSEVCQAYTRAFLDVVAKKFRFERVALGIDLRPSSPAIAEACAQAIRAAGYRVDFCGELPTPALALHAQRERIPAIMVTGSHIPFDRNGIKFYRPDGEITKADEAAISATRVPIHENTPAIALPPVNALALQSYEQRYLEFFGAGALAGLRLGLYEHSSVARDAFRHILEGLGAEVVSLGRTDVFVPIDTEAVSPADVERGRQWAAQHRLDALLSADGDGDRPLIGDEAGRWLRGDIVGLLCARHLGIRSLAVPVSCNTAIEKSALFARVVRTRIGSPYVIAALETFTAADAPVAGFEANGGFLLGSNVTRGRILEALPTRDAILPALAVLAAARAAGVPVSRLSQDLPHRFTASDRQQNVPAEASSRLIAAWAADPGRFGQLLEGKLGAPVAQDLTDGLRFTFRDGAILHLRPSGNAPELRCYAEAETQQRAEDLVRLVLGKITQALAQGSAA